MSVGSSAWHVALARIEGALAWIPPRVADALAMASLQRLWRAHVRDFDFENLGLEHDPGLESAELMRSWYIEERRDLLSWVSRRAPPPLARAARTALAAKAATESFTATYEPAERALERLDALLPSQQPVETLLEWVDQLRRDEVEFLEGDSELYEVGGQTFTRTGLRSAAWAASLAVAMRPQLFGLGAAPIALAGLAPRILFRRSPETPLPFPLEQALKVSIDHLAQDLEGIRQSLARGDQALAGLNASSRASDAWKLLIGLGPLTRAEIARGLEVTKRTASQAAAALKAAHLVDLRAGDGVLIAVRPA